MDFIVTLLAIIGCLWLVNFLYRMNYGRRKFKYMNDLIRRYKKDSTVEAAIDHICNGKPYDTISTDIYKWCMSHSPERDICERHRAKEEDFDKIFMDLCFFCSLTIKGFFIPISAFFFYPTLDYILKNKENLNSRQALNDLCDYFKRQ